MKALDLHQYYSYMKDNGLILAYKGALSQEIMASLADGIRDRLTDAAVQQRVIRRIFSIFIEMAQNIYRYSAEKTLTNGKKIGTGIVLLREEGDSFRIMSGNMVERDRVPELIQKCDDIRQLSPEALKQVYKNKLKATAKEGTIGAGVGLIDMARKAGYPIEHEVTAVNESLSFFVFSIRVKKGD